MEVDTGTTSAPMAMDWAADEPAADVADVAAVSSTATSPSDTLNTGEAESETDMPRSLTPDSSVENEDSPNRKDILSLSELWTEQSEKVTQVHTSFTHALY